MIGRRRGGLMGRGYADHCPFTARIVECENEMDC